MPYYTYILSNDTNTTVYVGMTNDLVRRVYAHKNKLADGFSKEYSVHKLVHYEEFGTAYDSITREKQLKSWSRKKKNELINQDNSDWKDLYQSLI